MEGCGWGRGHRHDTNSGSNFWGGGYGYLDTNTESLSNIARATTGGTPTPFQSKEMNFASREDDGLETLRDEEIRLLQQLLGDNR